MDGPTINFPNDDKSQPKYVKPLLCRKIMKVNAELKKVLAFRIANLPDGIRKASKTF